MFFFFFVSVSLDFNCPCFCFLQDSEPDIIDGVGAETGHVIRTSIGGRNGQSKQVKKMILGCMVLENLVVVES